MIYRDENETTALTPPSPPPSLPLIIIHNF